MGKPFTSSQLELARNRQRDSLDIFGQTSLLLQNARAPGSQTNVPLFSKVPGSAWDDALKAADRLLEGKDIPSGRPSNASRPSDASRAEKKSGKGPALGNAMTVMEHPQETSLDDLIVRLEAVEKESYGSERVLAGMLQEAINKEDHEAAAPKQPQQQYQLQQQRHQQWRDSRAESSDSRLSRKSSGSEATSRSEVSEDFMNERAAQWGYGVVLKGTSRDSTPRTSGGSSNGTRRSSSASQAVPLVSRDVKDALSSFMLAFLVCDATQPDFPILYASAGFTTMTGYTTEEISGKNCRFLQGPDTDRSEIAKVREALKNGALYTGTVLNYKKDGTPFWNLLTLSPIKDDDGKVIKYIGMQAEQNSKEAQPRNSKGQKSPAVRAVAKEKAVSATQMPQNQEKDKLTPDGAVGASQRRLSAGSNGSIPRPPLPQKASPATGPPERRTSGPEIRAGEDQTRRMSHRYSLTSNPVRSSRNSSVEEFPNPLYRTSRNSSVEDFPNPHYRRGSSRLQGVVIDNGKTSSSSEAPETPTKVDFSSSAASSERSRNSPSSEKTKGSRLTARILRLFRKDSKESKRRLEGGSARGSKEIAELSDFEDEIDNFTDVSARSSGSRRHSGVYSTPRSETRSTGRDSPQVVRIDASQVVRVDASTSMGVDASTSTDDLADLLAQMHVSGRLETMPSTRPAYDRSKEQFCIVESPSPRAPPSFDRNKQQFCIVQSPSPRAPPSFDRNKQQFCIVEGSSPRAPPAFDGNKQQFCIVEGSSPRAPPAFDGSKQQFCIVEDSSPRAPPAFDANKQQFCLVEPSPSAPAFDGSSKQQFCIVES